MTTTAVLSPKESPQQAPFSLGLHNPDVLTCIANLSNDEVFTPPAFANEMLDSLEQPWADAHEGASIWADPDVTFLDPFTKSGVFLREITRRLVDGLADQIPDLQQRVDHVLTKQVFGIGITELTALLARRSVYCSKDATGRHSIAKSFERDWGNIWFERTKHTWEHRKKVRQANPLTGDDEVVEQTGTGKCRYCGAAEGEYSRDNSLETHAYAFIHTDDPKRRLAEIFGADMHFDVIIGNPPYQLGSNGGTRDVPIYQNFVQQAKILEPRIICMVIQSRWMTSGLGLTHFRREMLNDTHLRQLVDFPHAEEVFPGTGGKFRGGVCYFVRESSHTGYCAVTTVRDGRCYGPVQRNMNEFDVFVRDARSLSKLRKVLNQNEESIIDLLSVDKEFGWTSNFSGHHAVAEPGDVPLWYVRNGKRRTGFVSRKEVKKSPELVDTWKVLVPKAGSGGDSVPDYVLGKTELIASPSVCTQTFLFFHLQAEDEARSVQSYVTTRFFRFLVSLRKITQNATRSTYSWVPIQTWDRTWTDEELYAKYGLTDEEVDFIESMIKPMELEPGSEIDNA